MLWPATIQREVNMRQTKTVLCKRDYVMTDGSVAFKAGKTYTFRRTGLEDWIIHEDENGEVHGMNSRDLRELGQGRCGGTGSR